MKSRALLAIVVLSTAMVSGGWLVERGLVGTRTATAGDASRMFAQVVQHIQRDFVDTLSDSVIYSHAAEGLLDELGDPHSAYLSPSVLKSLSERTSGRYAGIGAQVDVRDEWPTITAPLPGGAALEAGLQAGDRITEADGKPMHGVTVEEAQKVLRGPPGSVVKVTIERAGMTSPLKFALTRKEIHVASVQHPMLVGDGIGYVALTIFSQESAPDLKIAIDSLRKAGMHTLILDLRGNPGGLLDEGVGVSELFLNPAQRIVSMRGRTAQMTRAFDDKAPQPWPDMPMVVLVDSNTASAAEIVSGALQDHDRAVLMGVTTYGKGSAQNVFPLGDGGAAKLTTALWYTPSGRSINRKRPGADDDDGEAPKDTSMKARPKFKTDAGRTVLGGGGITPDVMLAPVPRPASDSAFERAIAKDIQKFRDALTDYAISMKASRAVASPDFVVTPAMRAELLRRMREHGVSVDERIYVAASGLIDRVLGAEIARYVFGDAAMFARRLRDDTGVQRAIAFARGARTEKELLDKAAR
jgi:carboxyl-terminal processing protease